MLIAPKFFQQNLTSCRSSNTGVGIQLVGVMITPEFCNASGDVYHWLVECSVFVGTADSVLRELFRLASFFFKVPGLAALDKAFCIDAVDKICERIEPFLNK